MIKVNDKNIKVEATLEACYEEQLPKININFLDRSKIGSHSYFDTTNTIYVYLGSKKNINYSKIYDVTRLYLTDCKHDLAINLDSFDFDKTNNGAKAAMNGSLFGHHNEYTLKTIKKNKDRNFNLITNNQITIDCFENSSNIIESVNFCRDINDAPPNICTPSWFVEQTKEKFKKLDNIKIHSLSKKECIELGMNLFISVGEGSINEPKFLVIEYNGDPTNKEKTAFIGKGVTFDTGGYALKPLIGQRNERYDMCGAGAVISSMYGISKSKPKSNIVCIAPLTENRIGGGTTLNSSIITSMNGMTVEIVSTDAEGRMIMADAITYAIRKLSATKLVTVATLTGAMISGLGKYNTGAMSNYDNFYLEIDNASKRANERLWRMPLDEESYDAMTSSKYADLNNHVWIKYNPPCNAGAFLDMFAENKPFVHIDIAGSAYINDRSIGTMVRTIIEYSKKNEK